MIICSPGKGRSLKVFWTLFLFLILRVYPNRSLGHALLVERASPLPAVDGVLNLPAQLPGRRPLLVERLDVLQRPVGGGQIIRA